MQTRTSLAFVIALVSIVNIYAGSETKPQYSSLFLEDEITVALKERDRVFTAFLPEMYGNAPATWSNEAKKRIIAAPDRAASSHSLWHHYLAALVHHSEKHPDTDQAFSNVMTLSRNRPAELLLLFFEFSRYHLTTYADTALHQLEKVLFAKGASASPVVSTHLLQMGLHAKMQHQREQALHLFTMAHRFNPLETASLRETLLLSLPFHFSDLFDALTNYTSVVAASWQAQLSLVHFLMQLLHRTGAFFVLLSTLLLCVKYFPRALHRFIHVYPASLSVTLRTVFVAMIVFSFNFFGFFTFFWLAAFTIKPYLEKRDIPLALVLLLCVLLSPLESYVRHSVESALVPENNIMQLSNAIHGYSNEPPHTSDNPRMNLVAAINAIKQGTPQTAQTYLQDTEDAFIDDPVFDNIKGIVLFMTGSIDSATAQFERILSYAPKNHVAYFNLSRCAIHGNSASKGVEYLKQAASLKPDIVNSFIQNNDNFYSDNWPLLRQLMFVDYSPSYFWKQILFTQYTSEDGFRHFWGLSFLGIPPVLSGVVFILLCSLVAVIGKKSRSDKKLKRLMECKYCGKIICRRCTKGILCPSCSEESKNINSDIPLDKIRSTIIVRAKATRTLFNALGNILMPGAGNIYSNTNRTSVTLFMVILSCIFYSLWFNFITGTALHTMSIIELFMIAIPMSIFNMYWIVRNVPILVQQGKLVISSYTSPGAR